MSEFGGEARSESNEPLAKTMVDSKPKKNEKNPKINPTNCNWIVPILIVEVNLKDLKVVDKGGVMAKLPNKLTWKNGLWIIGFFLALFFIYKISVGIFKSLFRSIGFEEGNN